MKRERVICESEIDKELDAQIRQGLCLCFPKDIEVFSKTRTWNNCPSTWTVMIEESNEIVAHLAIIDRTITVNGGQYRIAGIGNVFVLLEYRGQRLADKILKLAMEHSERLGFDFGILFTGSEVEKVYARNGWIKLEKLEIVRLEQNGKKSLWEHTGIMFYPLRLKEFPKGRINLEGPNW